MNKKPIIINAFHGIGDIIFSIPIYRELIAQGHTVIHPYLDTYGPIWKHWPEIAWIPKQNIFINYNNKQVVENEHHKILPLRWQEKPGAVMRSKYDYMGMDFMDWRKVTWVRDEAKEDELFQLAEKLNDGTPYCVINETFQHDDKGKVKITPPEGMRVVRMAKNKKYTLLDWAKILQNAAEIHTVSTSLVYLLDCEFLNINCPMHLYPRHKGEGLGAVDYLLTKKYIVHE